MDDLEFTNLNLEKGKLPYTEELDALMIYITDRLSQELPTLFIDVDYFILGVFMERKNNIYKLLRTCMFSTTIEQFNSTWYQAVSTKALTAVKSNRTPKYETKFLDYVSAAMDEAREMGSDVLASEHIFLSILKDNNPDNKVKKAFNKASVTYGSFKECIKNRSKFEGKDTFETELPNGGKMKVINFSSPEAMSDFMEKLTGGELPDSLAGGMDVFGRTKPKGKTFISSFCSNLMELAANGSIEPLIGREKETNEIIRILGRRRKNNAILVGGEGVGKTAIAEALALKIINAEVPQFLMNKSIVSLDMTALMAGTTLRGMFEERVKGVMDEIKANKNIILFIDNIGAILADKGKNDYDFSAMLSRSLETGEVQVIGTSDFASYRKTFDSDPSLARRFQKIVVEAPTVNESVEILKGLKNSYEDYHCVTYTDDAIVSCVCLADRYITERNLPDSAIDLLDEIGAMRHIEQKNPEIDELKADLLSMKKRISELKDEKKFKEADALNVEFNKKFKDVVELQKEMLKHKELVTIDKSDVLELISIKTGIPVNNLSADDKENLVNMNERLKNVVIGQDEAIDTICRALRRNRVGLKKNGCLYSVMSIGRSGVGKTLIAKQLAKELFGDERNIVRFDMSEYSDKVAVNKLIGSNPGYVGYEEGGQLTETIKNKKHCVLLLDEIEKADPEIYNIFLQVLDEGFLTDNSGMRVDFKNVIVMFTSNVGTKSASEFGKGIGFTEDVNENSKKILSKELKSKFPPEFLNRIDNIIYFNTLTDENLKAIIKLEIEKMNVHLKDIGYTSIYDEQVVDFLFDIVKDQKDFGARPILRAIQENIEDKITDRLLEKNYDEGYEFKIRVKDKDIFVS